MAESEYAKNLVLKGGMLVTSMLDIGQRMTRDTDVTMQNLTPDVESAAKMTRAIAAIHTRMRDFYDMWALDNMGADIDYAVLAEAIAATAKTRGHDVTLADCESVVDALAASKDMAGHWERYQNRNDFAAGLSWEDALDAIRNLCNGALNS